MFKCPESWTSFPIYFHLFMFQRTINLVPTLSCHVSKESEKFFTLSMTYILLKIIFVAFSEIELCYIQSTFMSIAYLRIANWFSSVTDIDKIQTLWYIVSRIKYQNRFVQYKRMRLVPQNPQSYFRRKFFPQRGEGGGGYPAKEYLKPFLIFFAEI